MGEFSLIVLDCTGACSRFSNFWQASALICNRMCSRHGVDRVGGAAGIAAKEHVIFDPAVPVPSD